MIKIFTITHKKFEPPKDNMYIPLHVGRKGKNALGYLGDDTGDNISDKNCYYSELTGQYWIWKNYHDSDYVGLCHYRRYLINEDEKLFTEKELEQLLQQYDIITTKKLVLNNSYHLGYEANHHIKDLDATEEIIKEKYPAYYENYKSIIYSNRTYFGNIIVTSKKIFDEYTKWLFDIFFELEKRIDIDSYDDYHKRVFGFISEILLLVYTTTNNLKVCECKVGMLGAKVETRQMKQRLGEYFKVKDILGAEKYFEEMLKKRPDVLMEASDIDGELKLAMQVIATCDIELKINNKSVLDDCNDFKKLVNHFRHINNIMTRRNNGEVLEADNEYLIKHNVSGAALEVSERILKTERNKEFI